MPDFPPPASHHACRLLLSRARALSLRWNAGSSRAATAAAAADLLSLNWTHYTLFWAIALGTDVFCLAFVFFLLPESMPDKLRRPFSWWFLNP